MSEGLMDICTDIILTGQILVKTHSWAFPPFCYSCSFAKVIIKISIDLSKHLMLSVVLVLIQTENKQHNRSDPESKKTR